MRLWIAAALLIMASTAEAGTLRFTCTYSTVFEFGDRAPKDAKGFRLEFLLDDSSGKAVLVGNAGMSDVGVHIGGEGLTFLERLPTGAIQLTTITKGGNSVHSRHSMIKGDLIPSQYFGTCK